MATKHILGAALVLVILSASIYFVLSDEYRIDIKNTYTSFKVYENGSWELAGEERSILYDGTKKMRAIGGRIVNYTIEDNITTAYRYAYFKNNITLIDKYIFNSSTDDVEIFPVSHEIQILGAKGAQENVGKSTPYILVYEVNKLEYFGETDYELGNSHEFGHNMKVEWSSGNYYERLYKYKDKDQGKLEIKYRITSNDFSVQARLFDPIISPDSVFTNLIYNQADINKGTAIFEVNNPVDNLSLDDLYYTYDLVKGNGLSRLDVFVEETNSIEEPTYDYIQYEDSCEVYDNLTKITHIESCNQTVKTQNGTKTISFLSWNKIDYLEKGFHKIKIVGYFESIGENSLDWFPNIILDKNKYSLPKNKFGKMETLNFKQSKWAWWNTSWDHYREYTNLTGNITYMFINKSSTDNDNWNDTRFLSCYNDTLVFNHTLEAEFGTFGQFRVNHLGENCTRRYYGNSEATSTSSASNVYFNPVSAYYFDANANDFVGSNDGTPIGGANLVAGYINGSYNFDGSNDYISLGSTSSLDIGSGSWSYSSWINPDSQTKTWNVLFSKGASGENPIQWAYTDSSRYTHMQVEGTGDQVSSTGTIQIQNSVWTHIVFTYNPTSKELITYVNGAIDNTLDFTGVTPGTVSPIGDFKIGDWTTVTSEFDGKMDETYIYPYELTAIQVKILATQTESNFIEGNEQNQTPVDTCTYTSGDWQVDCSDNCVITSNVNLGANDLIFSNSGNFFMNANITYGSLILSSGCDIVLSDNTQLIS